MAITIKVSDKAKEQLKQFKLNDNTINNIANAVSKHY